LQARFHRGGKERKESPREGGKIRQGGGRRKSILSSQNPRQGRGKKKATLLPGARHENEGVGKCSPNAVRKGGHQEELLFRPREEVNQDSGKKETKLHRKRRKRCDSAREERVLKGGNIKKERLLVRRIQKGRVRSS